MWRSCVDFFAAGTWHGRRCHVVQSRFEWDDRVGCKRLATCSALMVGHTAQLCHWWWCKTTLTGGFVVNTGD